MVSVRKIGNVYQYKFDIEPVDGKRKRITKSGFKTKGEAENICNRVIMINKGKIIKTGTPEEIKKDTNTSNLRDAFFTLIGGVSVEE